MVYVGGSLIFFILTFVYLSATLVLISFTLYVSFGSVLASLHCS